MATDLAAPDRHEGARVAVGAAPCQDVAVGSLDDGEDMTGALVGHCGERESWAASVSVSMSMSTSDNVPETPSLTKLGE